HTGPRWHADDNRGRTRTVDPAMQRAKGESAHPLEHVMTRSIPTSQCIVCHVHPGTTVENSYLGTIWWDNETDAEGLYRKAGDHPTSWEIDAIQRSNPEGSAIRGRWSDVDVLSNLTDLNAQSRHVQFADFHGHGWIFRNVYEQNRAGQLLDKKGEIVPDD